MKDQLFEELAKRHPDLFQKSEVDYFECGDGWYDILDILCGKLNYPVHQCRSIIQHYINLNDQDKEAAEQAKLVIALDNLPTMRQVKEKFGTLRFYADGVSDVQQAYITFAESMTGRVCQDCGNRGESRNDGWVRVLCDEHHQNGEYIAQE